MRRRLPHRCEGPTAHAAGCHPRRPRCKWRRKTHEKWVLCNCGVYHFAHRKGSGRCGDLVKQWRHLYGDEAVDEWLKTAS